MSEGCEEEGKRGRGEEGQPPQTTKTELGREVPAAPGEEYREHTAARWRDPNDQRGDPASYEFCLHLIKALGILNKSELKRLVDDHRAARGKDPISRNSIIALFHDRTLFKNGEIDEIIRTRSALLTADTINKLEEIIDTAKSAKDIGGVAMALTALFNVKQISHGAATRITGKSDDADKARSYDFYRARAQAKLAEKQLRAGIPAPSLDVMEAEIIAPAPEKPMSQCKNDD